MQSIALQEDDHLIFYFNQNIIKIYTLHCKTEPFLPHKKGNILPLIYQY